MSNLDRELQGSDFGQTLNILGAQGNTAQNLLSSILHSLYESGSHYRLYNPSYALRSAIDSYEQLKRDPKFTQAIEHRLNTVAGSDYIIRPADDSLYAQKLADLVTDLLKPIKNFYSAKKQLASYQITGISAGFLKTRRKETQIAGIEDIWTLPTEIQPIDWRLIQTRYTRKKDGVLPEVEYQYFDITDNDWLPIKLGDKRSFIVARYQDEPTRFGYGRPLADSLYFYWWVKTQLIRLGLEGFENWARGVIEVGRDALADSDEDDSNSDLVSDTQRQIEEMRKGKSFIHDKRHDYELHFPEFKSEAILEWISYIDDAILGLLTGSILPQGGGASVGSLARSEVEKQVSNEQLRAAKEDLDNIISNQLIYMLVYYNQPALRRHGLLRSDIEHYLPVYDSRNIDDDDQGQKLETLKSIKDLGIEITREDLLNTLGIETLSELF